MIKAAAMKGWIDEDQMICETAAGIYRAGCDILLTYFAKRHVIQTFLSFQFNVAQIKRHDSRIITTHTFHVTAIFVTFPADTVKRIVMMTKHNPLCGNLP